MINKSARDINIVHLVARFSVIPTIVYEDD